MKKSTLHIVLIMLLIISHHVLAAASGPGNHEYYVSPMGNDKNDGSFEKPFLSISKAVKLLSPGDILYLREGSYHEEVHLDGVKGTVEEPIIIRPYKDEKVIMDGTIEIRNPEWEKHHEYANVWQAKIEQDIWQLFVDDRMMINARWPNAEHPFENEERSSWWSRGKSWRHVQYKIDDKVVSGFDFERARGFLVDDGAGEPLVDLPRSAEGLMGVLNVNSMTTLVGRISKHDAGSPYFEYDVNAKLQAQVRDPGQKNLRRILTKNASHAYYYFEGWAELIDAPDEWAYDKNTGLLYLYSEDGKSLNNHKIRGKVQTSAFLLKECENISIQGLHFFATCVQAFDCKRFHVEDNIFDYPSYSKRMLGSLEEIEVLTIESSYDKSEDLREADPEHGTHNVFRNNIVRYSDGRGLHVSGGAFDVVDNNYFKYIDISGTPGGSVGIWTTGWRNVFKRNTLEICSSSKATKGGDAGLVALNRISKFGYLQDDGTAIQGGGKGQQGTVFTQNWVHDSPKSGLRFDGDERVNAYERQTLNGSMVRNVVFNNNGGLMVKGDDHRVYNNTIFNTANDAYKILTSEESEHSNHQTIARNNIGDFMNASRRDDPLENLPVGPTDHNWVNKYPQRDIREILRDPENLDFRPRKDATEIIDRGVDVPEELLWCGVTLPDFTSDFKVGKAPDIGAYEFGSDNYWIAGFQDVKATTPIPPDGTTTAKTDADLMWLPARNSELFRVYFGTSREDMKLLAEQDNNIASPGTLDPAYKYFWRVDCKTEKGWVTGDVWKFQARGFHFDRSMSLPSSYVENFVEAFDFDRDNLEQNERGLIMPWIRPHYNGDFLEIRDGSMWIEPSVERRNEFEPIEIPNINVDLGLYPSLSFAYKTTNREDLFGLFAGFIVPGGKGNNRSIFPEKPAVMLQPSPDGFTTMRIELDELVEQAVEVYGNSVAKSFLLQFYGPEDVQWNRKDGGIYIKDFQIGFASLLENVSSILISGQRDSLNSNGEGIRINHNMLVIEVKLDGNESVFTYPGSDPLPGNWNLIIQPGENYRVIDKDIVKPEKNFTGRLKVRAIIEAEGISSNSFEFDISVLQKKRQPESELPVEKYEADWESLRKHTIPGWAVDAKFGIYAHWGPYSQTGSWEDNRNINWGNYYITAYRGIYDPNPEEARRKTFEKRYGSITEGFGYRDLCQDFKASAFDPVTWADLIERSGAKYAGICAIHHDGYAMWDSEVTPHNAATTGPKRDLLGEMLREIEKRGLKTIATFHHARTYKHFQKLSEQLIEKNIEGVDILDTTNYDYYWFLGTQERFEENRYKLTKEVIDKYKPDILWFDGGGGKYGTEQILSDFFNMGIAENKEVCVHNKGNFGKNFGIYSYENGAHRPMFVDWPWEDDTPSAIGWCDWPWWYGIEYKKPRDVVVRLCDLVARNGGLLLSLNPLPDGSLDKGQIELLEGIGRWLKQNGEAIYGTRPWKVHAEGHTESTAYSQIHPESKKESRRIQPDPKIFDWTDFRFTTKVNTLYAIELGIPPKDVALIKSLNTGIRISDVNQITSVELIGYGKVQFKRSPEGLKIYLPDELPNNWALAFKIEVAGNLENIPLRGENEIIPMKT